MAMANHYVTNIVHTYLQGTPEEIAEGAHWYDKQNALCRELCPDNVWRAAGVIAAYSPLTPWWRNRELAIDSLITGIARNDSLGMNVRAAQRILDGEHTLDVLKGDKVRAFASAIADPDNSTIATIDRHAHDIAMGRVFDNHTRKIGKRVFRTLSDAYCDAADMLGHSVAQTQAIVWVIWRNRLPRVPAPAATLVGNEKEGFKVIVMEESKN